MKINFDMDINVSDWAEAIGYTVVGDKVISKNVFTLSDFEKCVSDYISETIEGGTNSNLVVENFFHNDDEQHCLRGMLEECQQVKTIPSVVGEITDMDSLKREEKLALIVDGADAVFLPGKIHGCEDQLYIIYHNNEANSGNGSFEIEIIDYERVLKLAAEKDMCAEVFFEKLSDMFQGEWRYCNSDSEEYWNFVEEYFDADFAFGRDGEASDEFEFIVNWAKERKAMCEKTRMKFKALRHIFAKDTLFWLDTERGDGIRYDENECFSNEYDEREVKEAYSSRIKALSNRKAIVVVLYDEEGKK